MPLAGVTHCPSCHAVINAHWQTCPACSYHLRDKHVPTEEQWLAAWRELARLTNGIEKKDPRYHQIMDDLDACDRAFAQGDWSAFQASAVKIKPY